MDLDFISAMIIFSQRQKNLNPKYRNNRSANAIWLTKQKKGTADGREFLMSVGKILLKILTGLLQERILVLKNRLLW